MLGRKLIELSVALTVVWAFICLYVALNDLHGAIPPLIERGSRWFEPARQLHWFYFGRAFLWWALGASMWWGLLYAVLRQQRLLPVLNTRAEPPEAGSGRAEILSWAIIVGLLAAVIFVSWPEIDFDLSNWFNIAPRGFLFDHQIAPLTTGLQVAAKIVTWLAVIGAASGLVIAVTTKRRVLGFGLAHWLFLLLVLILGPALLVNSVLKEHSERPRPIHVVQFGGKHSFTPIFQSGECTRNCSFVSGEAASIYALGFALALLARRRRKAILIAAILAGSVVGFVRIGQGAHFLSDIVFAGVFMAIVVALAHWVTFRVVAPQTEPNLSAG